MVEKSLWLLLLFIMVFTSGCWDRRELENLAVVLGMGLNHTPGGRAMKSLSKLCGRRRSKVPAGAVAVGKR